MTIDETIEYLLRVKEQHPDAGGATLLEWNPGRPGRYASLEYPNWSIVHLDDDLLPESVRRRLGLP